MSRFARKVDSSHKAVVLAFRALGCSVVAIQSAIAGCPDLAVGFAGRTHLVEIKREHIKGRSRAEMEAAPAQVRFALAWRGGPVNVVRSPEDAAAMVKCWRQEQETEHRAAQLLAAQNGGKNER